MSVIERRIEVDGLSLFRTGRVQEVVESLVMQVVQDCLVHWDDDRPRTVALAFRFTPRPAGETPPRQVAIDVLVEGAAGADPLYGQRWKWPGEVIELAPPECEEEAGPLFGRRTDGLARERP